jgi:GDPmannose 4,6-dehydratase
LTSAIITGITGQDGYYLAELLLEKGYTVYGMHRRVSSSIPMRLSNLLNNYPDSLILRYGDLTDSASISKIIMLKK